MYTVPTACPRRGMSVSLKQRMGTTRRLWVCEASKSSVSAALELATTASVLP